MVSFLRRKENVMVSQFSASCSKGVLVEKEKGEMSRPIGDDCSRI